MPDKFRDSIFKRVAWLITHVTDQRLRTVPGLPDQLLQCGGSKGCGFSEESLPPPLSRVPLWALSVGGQCGDIVQALLRKPAPLSSTTLGKLIGQAWYSPEALIRDTGYQPRYAFDDAVPELIRHYRSSLS